MAWPDFSYDSYCDFEAGLGSWTEVDASSVLNVANNTAEYYGSLGALYDQTGGALAYVMLDIGSDHDAVSGGFWYRSPTWTAYTYNIFFNLKAASDNDTLRGYWGKNAGDDSRLLQIRGAAFSGNNSSWGDGAWYWFTFQFTKNGTMYLQVYDTTHTQVGAEISTAAGAEGTRYIRILGDTACATDPFFDDIVIDHTDATYPLLGWETAAAGGTLLLLRKS